MLPHYTPSPLCLLPTRRYLTEQRKEEEEEGEKTKHKLAPVSVEQPFLLRAITHAVGQWHVAHASPSAQTLCDPHLAAPHWHDAHPVIGHCCQAVIASRCASVSTRESLHFPASSPLVQAAATSWSGPEITHRSPAACPKDRFRCSVVTSRNTW